MEFGYCRNRTGNHMALDMEFACVHPERVPHSVQPIQGVAAWNYMQQLAIVGKGKFAGGFFSCRQIEVRHRAHAVGAGDVDPAVFRFDVSPRKSRVDRGDLNAGIRGCNCQ